MVDIIKNLVDEEVLVTLILLLGASREVREYLKLYLEHKVEMRKIELQEPKEG